MAGKKIDAFAGLRGYAIILVFLSHYSFGANSKGLNITNWLGALGVEVFIILSGFLLMENHGNTMFEFKPYYIRKVKKFYPLHFIMLLMAIPFSVKPLLGLDIEKWIALFSQVMLVQTWFPKPDIYFSFNGVAWYLSLTVFFIAVSPLTVKIWNKLTMRSSVIMMAGIAAAEIILCVVFRKSAFAHWILYVAPFVRILDFFMGGGVLEYGTNLP